MIIQTTEIPQTIKVRPPQEILVLYKSVNTLWACTQSLNFKLIRSPRIDSKEPIPLGCVACRAGTTTLFLLGS